MTRKRREKKGKKEEKKKILFVSGRKVVRYRNVFSGGFKGFNRQIYGTCGTTRSNDPKLDFIFYFPSISVFPFKERESFWGMLHNRAGCF